MVDLLVKRLQLRDDLSSEEIGVLRAMVGERVQHARRTTIVREGDHQTRSNLLVQGWAARVKILPDGRRQITQVHMPGDFIDLHSFLLKRLDHSIVALTSCAVVYVEHERLRRISETHPHLTRMLWLSTLIDAAIHREWLAVMGRATARQHIANLLCELYLRLETIGLASEHKFELPLTQEELADVCGLTAVHVNRVLQELRGEGLIFTSGRTVHIPDWEGLQRAAQFDPTYLNLFKEPR